MVQCPQCNRILLDSTQDGGYKLRTRMLLFKDEKAIAICPSCKTHVEVPITLDYDKPQLPKKKIVINT